MKELVAPPDKKEHSFSNFKGNSLGVYIDSTEEKLLKRTIGSHWIGWIQIEFDSNRGFKSAMFQILIVFLNNFLIVVLYIFFLESFN